nr:cellulase [uncultured bacterium]
MTKRSRKLCALITCIALIATLLFPGNGITQSKGATNLTAAQIQRGMGLGFNIGNTFDSSNNDMGCLVSNHELHWGNPAVTQAYVDAIYDKGFRSIRLPITWYEFITEDNGTYSIKPEYLARVKEVVDYAYNKNMYVIINVHHENWINRSDLAASYNSISPKLKGVWKVIAEYFSDYDQRLIFEGMNEPRLVGVEGVEWVGNAEAYNVVNKLDKDFISTVRSVASPYKSTRLLMVPSYAASVNPVAYEKMDMTMFNDPYVAASIHAYSPYNFAMGNGDHSDFSPYKAELESIFAGLRTTFTSKKIPVILGEFSSSNFNNQSARVAWAKCYMEQAKKLGIPCVLWDNDVIAMQDDGEAHGYLNRATNKWYSESEPVVNALLSTLNDSSIVWKSESVYPIYKHNATTSGTELNVSEYFVFDNPSSIITSGKEIAIKYTTKTPKIALANGAWGNWTEIMPTDLDIDNKIAYFSCDTMLNAWTSADTIANMKILDSSGNGIQLPAYLISYSGERAETSEEDISSEDNTTSETSQTTQTSQSSQSSQTTQTSQTKPDNSSESASSQDKSESKPNATQTIPSNSTTTVTPSSEVESFEIGTALENVKGTAKYKVMGKTTDGTPMVQFVASKSASSATVTVPATVNINGTACKVTSIAPKAFYKNKKLKKIVIGANIVRIGKQAFYGCTNLKKVIIKKKPKQIGKQAFGKCNKLKKISIANKNVSAKKYK